MKILFGADPHYIASNIASRKDNYPKTMLNKTEQLLDMGNDLGIDLLALGGDFGHSPELSKLYENKLIDLYRKYPFPKACIMGNHDLYNADPGSIAKTSLGTFYKSGIFMGAKETQSMCGNTLVFMPYMDSQKMIDAFMEHDSVVSAGGKLILFAHYYLPGKYPDDNLPEQLTHVFDYIFLGHDHDAAPIKAVNKSIVIQPGALSRGTRQKSNWNRPVQVAYLDTDTGECRYIPLQYQPAEEVFDQKRIVLEKHLKDTSIFDELSKSVVLQKSSDISNIITELNLPNDIRKCTEDWLRSVSII